MISDVAPLTYRRLAFASGPKQVHLLMGIYKVDRSVLHRSAAIGGDIRSHQGLCSMGSLHGRARAYHDDRAIIGAREVVCIDLRRNFGNRHDDGQEGAC